MTALEIDPIPILEDGFFDWPIFGLQDDIRPALADAMERGLSTVVATLYGVSGAAPRGVGAQMIFTEKEASGFLSGGCIEADLALHAQRVAHARKSERLVYGDGGPIDIRLPCGSRIDVLLEPLRRDDAAALQLLQLEQKRRPAVWITDGDYRICVPPNEIEDADAKLSMIASQPGFATQICGYLEEPFVAFRAFAPRRRLIAIGADPIALAVVKLAAEAGFETILVRPRGPENCPVPGVHYDRSEVQNAILTLDPDPWTAIAVLTHDLDQELESLIAALASKAGYVGVLGSRGRIRARVAGLIASGVSEQDAKRVHAPIGLAIGGKSPWDIAISIIAEIVSELGVNATGHVMRV